MQANVELPLNPSMNPSMNPPGKAARSRRRDARFEVDGAVVRSRCEPFAVHGAYLRLQEGWIASWTGSYGEPWDLLNLSKGGLAFRADYAFRRGRRLRILLAVPGLEEPLALVASVRWCKSVAGYYHDVGLQFAPFGDGPGMNPPEALGVLRHIERCHRRTT